MALFWIGAVIVFGVVEALTAGLVSIWFVVGAVGALIASLLTDSIVAQSVVFLAVSAIALAATRPLVKKLTKRTPEATNLDRVLGMTARVTEQVDAESGAVYVDGKTWSAHSADGSVIPAGAQVRVERMEGVKLLVKQEKEKVEVL